MAMLVDLDVAVRPLRIGKQPVRYYELSLPLPSGKLERELRNVAWALRKEKVGRAAWPGERRLYLFAGEPTHAAHAPTTFAWHMDMMHGRAAHDLTPGHADGRQQGEGATVAHPDTGWADHPEYTATRSTARAAATSLPIAAAGPPRATRSCLVTETRRTSPTGRRPDLNRSPIELAASAEPASACPACWGGRFGFPGELGESAAAMCPVHRGEADRVSSERFERAKASNPDGWGAVLDSCRRLELPHLPNGLASRLVGAEDLMFELREPDELAAVVHGLVEVAGWFRGRAEDLAVALGAEEDMPWLPEWMENLVLDLGRAGLAAEAAEAADALIRIDPDNESTYAADLGCALAEAGDDPAARAQIEASLARWPSSPGFGSTQATPWWSWAMPTERKHTSSPPWRWRRRRTTSSCAPMSSTASPSWAALPPRRPPSAWSAPLDAADGPGVLGSGVTTPAFAAAAASTSTATASRPDTQLHNLPTVPAEWQRHDRTE